MSRNTWCRDPKCGSGKRDVQDMEVQDNEKILRQMSTNWTRVLNGQKTGEIDRDTKKLEISSIRGIVNELYI